MSAWMKVILIGREESIVDLHDQEALAAGSLPSRQASLFKMEVPFRIVFGALEEIYFISIQTTLEFLAQLRIIWFLSGRG